MDRPFFTGLKDKLHNIIHSMCVFKIAASFKKLIVIATLETITLNTLSLDV